MSVRLIRFTESAPRTTLPGFTPVRWESKRWRRWLGLWWSRPKRWRVVAWKWWTDTGPRGTVPGEAVGVAIHLAAFDAAAGHLALKAMPKPVSRELVNLSQKSAARAGDELVAGGMGEEQYVWSERISFTRRQLSINAPADREFQSWSMTRQSIPRLRAHRSSSS